ncbi:hypothetical protein BP6252_09419 [Coleophoma cylindrospora]|uniref:HCP-like protein n=1 Tax=Coleophoma cylindrospora TaxID=1849047 RepID=A0A3D8R1V7_9HELO|nr:hypothetical protein BP6252_09419 [Coleophoma cylindrospora]
MAYHSHPPPAPTAQQHQQYGYARHYGNPTRAATLPPRAAASSQDFYPPALQRNPTLPVIEQSDQPSYVSRQQLPGPPLYAPHYNNMSSHEYQKAQLGATFYPGGYDDFQMPELVSPSPQRIMPEVPSNMQESLANLELEARNPQSRVSSTSSSYFSQSTLEPAPLQPRGGTPSNMGAAGPQYTASYDHTNASAYQNLNGMSKQYVIPQHPPESPNFSPFPKPRDAGPNVPLSDEDKEEVLERARSLVLKSNDPEMQLAWAQDALAWVEVANQNHLRLAESEQSSRSVTPKVEHQLRVDAINIVVFLAEQQHPRAEFIKSMWLEFGKFGYRVDKKEAFLGYRRAADKGYARAEYRIGMQYESTNDPVKAIKHYNIGVSLKDSASSYRLGMMTLLGQHNQPQDYEEGLKLIRFAADTADENAPQGAYVYGMLLARELPNITIPDAYLPFDTTGAKLYIEKAAYLGFAKAQTKMAQAYELCQLGCDFDAALSLHYNALAARQGESEADMAISKWFLCGQEGIFEKNEELAFTYAKRAAQAKMSTAEFAMGYFYEIGMYVKPDLQEAQAWYKKASDHGNKDALGRIDSISRNKALSKSDHEQIAISRIKSTHGSMRGKRPDRLKQRNAPMASMSEERVDMPSDQRTSYVPPQSAAPPVQRPVSAAPYPEDDMVHPHSAGHAPLSPYYKPNLRASSGIGPPMADRPSSAFGVRPPAHSNTTPYPANTLRPMEQPMRPSTSQGNMPLPAGRGVPTANRVPSPNWEPQMPGNFVQTPSRTPVASPNPPPASGARLQKQPQSNMMKPQPPKPGYGAELGSRKPVPGQAPVPPKINPAPYEGKTSATPSSQRPDRYDSMSVPSVQLQNPPPRFDSAQSHRSEPSRASQRPAQQTMSSQDPRASTMSSATTSTTTSTASKASKGPSTFEEMGIPAQKTEGDCIVM